MDRTDTPGWLWLLSLTYDFYILKCIKNNNMNRKTPHDSESGSPWLSRLETGLKISREAATLTPKIPACSPSTYPYIGTLLVLWEYHHSKEPLHDSRHDVDVLSEDSLIQSTVCLPSPELASLCCD